MAHDRLRRSPAAKIGGLVAAGLFVATAFLARPSHARAADPVIGSSGACTDFKLELLPYIETDITDEGWVWVQRSAAYHTLPRYQDASGVVRESQVASNDTPANHNSHDQNTDIVVDDTDRGVLSNVNWPNTVGLDDTEHNDGADNLTDPKGIEVEWELGTFPNEKGPAVPQRYFPRWAWPSVGDRVWTNGHWAFDCGHAKKIGVFRPNPPNFQPPQIFIGDDYWRSEIHPPRAMAAMRRQADTLPGTGTTPVPVTSTDLYVHGEAGFVTDILFCGMSIIVNGVGGNGDPDACPNKTTPIATNFEFDICLPVQPFPGAELVSRISNGPANTVGSHQVVLDEMHPASARCANDGNLDEQLYDGQTSLHATVPLAGSGVGDVEVYARKIVSGWVAPPQTPLQHLRMTLDNVNVHFSGDGGVIASDDGELTFFFANVDRAPNEWIRLADYAPVASNGNSEMNDYDPSPFGDSFKSLGAIFDFYALPDEEIGIHALAYDQDCYDDHFGDHTLTVGTYVGCALDVHETGNNDSLDDLEVDLEPPAYGSSGPGICPGVAAATGSALCNVTSPFKPRIKSFSPPNPPVIEFRPDYELNFTLAKLAPTVEDTANLGVSKTCSHGGEVLLVDQPLRCAITVTNPGPGLPRGVVVTDEVSGLSPSSFAISDVSVDGGGGTCQVLASKFSCQLPTLRVGGTAIVRATLTPHTTGTLGDDAGVSTSSSDPVAANNSSHDEATVFLPVNVVVKPGAGTPSINVGGRGLIPVAILTTPTFNATAIIPSTVCFGDSGAPTERDCTEAHGTGHREDVDRDRDVDLLLHYETEQAGIDAGDTSACLTATTSGGVHVYGCGAVVAR